MRSDVVIARCSEHLVRAVAVVRRAMLADNTDQPAARPHANENAGGLPAQPDVVAVAGGRQQQVDEQRDAGDDDKIADCFRNAWIGKLGNTQSSFADRRRGVSKTSLSMFLDNSSTGTCAKMSNGLRGRIRSAIRAWHSEYIVEAHTGQKL